MGVCVFCCQIVWLNAECSSILFFPLQHHHPPYNGNILSSHLLHPTSTEPFPQMMKLNNEAAGKRFSLLLPNPMHHFSSLSQHLPKPPSHPPTTSLSPLPLLLLHFVSICFLHLPYSFSNFHHFPIAFTSAHLRVPSSFPLFLSPHLNQLYSYSFSQSSFFLPTAWFRGRQLYDWQPI